jgi:uncharacterized protein (DUF983 family)
MESRVSDSQSESGPHSDWIESPPRSLRPPLEQLISRALRLRCPRCGDGVLFIGWFTMPERCSACGLKYERAPGYFLGSAYINYGAIALLTTVSFIVLRFGFHVDTVRIKYPLLAVAMILPLYTFRYARALWLALDCHFDKSVLADETAGDNDL